MDEYIELVFSNFKKCFIVDVNELNVYFLVVFSFVVMEEVVF